MRMKLLIGALALCVMSEASAQIPSSIQPRVKDLNPASLTGTGVRLAAPDTTSGADTNYLQWQVTVPYDIHITHTNTKVSGTVAGTAMLFGSDDGVTWFALNNTATGGLAAGQVSDTASLGDATETNHWFYGGPTVYKFKYYRLRSIYSNGSSAPTGRLEGVLPNGK